MQPVPQDLLKEYVQSQHFPIISEGLSQFMRVF